MAKAEPERLAELVVGAIKAALAPVVARQQLLTEELLEVKRALADRTAEQAHAALVERVIAAEVKLAQPLDTGDLRDRLMALETRTAGPDAQLAQAALSERISILETKASAPDAAPPQPDDGHLVDLRARVAALEMKAQAEDSAALRERLAVLETRAPVPGPPGKDGLDGLGYDDFDEHYDGERTYTKTYRRGDQAKVFTHIVPHLLDQGVYQAGRSYVKGDGVTWGGSFWIAQADTSAKPGEAGAESRAWRLAVKAGRDAKLPQVSSRD